MNPTNDIPADDDWLDAVLRESGRDHRADYVADDGFSASVMAQLPHRAELPAWRRPIVFAMWLLVGIAALMSFPPLFDQVFRDGVALVMGHRVGLIDVAVILAILSTATWAGLVYAARID